MRFIASIITLLVLLVSAHQTSAHESRPLYVEIAEKAPNAFAVTWKALYWMLELLSFVETIRLSRWNLWSST